MTLLDVRQVVILKSSRQLSSKGRIRQTNEGEDTRREHESWGTWNRRGGKELMKERGKEVRSKHFPHRSRSQLVDVPRTKETESVFPKGITL